MTAPATQVWVTAPGAWVGWRERLVALDPVERGRLGAIVVAETARAYAVLHLLARDVLGRLVGADPASLAFARPCDRCEAQHGPPRLVGHPGIHVSLSRTTGFVAVAVSTVAPVGVDVERVAATGFAGFDAVATHPTQRTPQRSEHDRARSWVRKEAALKALGVGLRAGPDTVREPPPGEVAAVLPGHPPVLVTDLDLSAAPGSQGHLAALGLVVTRPDAAHADRPGPDVVVHPC